MLHNYGVRFMSQIKNLLYILDQPVISKKYMLDSAETRLEYIYLAQP